jgi:hypothetical protein
MMATWVRMCVSFFVNPKLAANLAETACLQQFLEAG